MEPKPSNIHIEDELVYELPNLLAKVVFLVAFASHFRRRQKDSSVATSLETVSSAPEPLWDPIGFGAQTP